MTSSARLYRRDVDAAIENTCSPAAITISEGVSSFVEVESYIDAFTMVAAIMGGSFLYWFVVSQFIATIRHRLDVVRLGQINRIAGLVLIGFGCVLIGEMVVKRLRFW